jgi:hypothetical protein
MARFEPGLDRSRSQRHANDHELDAISCALAGRQFLAGKGITLGGDTGILLLSPAWYRGLHL